jgi:hypothetical protein
VTFALDALGLAVNGDLRPCLVRHRELLAHVGGETIPVVPPEWVVKHARDMLASSGQ